MIDRSAPVLVHAWLGPLYRNGTDELAGSIDLDPAVRIPRRNGAQDAEILLEVQAVSPAPGLEAHVDACAARIRCGLDRLPELKRYAINYAPPEWLRHYGAQPGPPLINRLFLDTIEVSPLLLRVRYGRADLAFEISLVLSYMGEEYVATDVLSEDDSGSVCRTQIGSTTAHTGYQMRHALDRQAEAVRRVLRERMPLCAD